MTAYDSAMIEWKQADNWSWPTNPTHEYIRGMLGTYGLTFPTSPGGPNIILEFSSDV